MTMHRDTALVGIGAVVAVLIGGWILFMTVIAVPTEDMPQAVMVTQIDAGQYSGSISERKNYHVETTAEWQALWTMVHGLEGPALPPVDFERYQVLAVFDGTHSSGGYAINITSIADTGLRRIVRIKHTEPGEECLAASVITSPYQMVVVPRSSATIARENITETVACP